jgi:uncharacterized membrane protein YvlD (DUF360 family)
MQEFKPFYLVIDSDSLNIVNALLQGIIFLFIITITILYILLYYFVLNSFVYGISSYNFLIGCFAEVY